MTDSAFTRATRAHEPPTIAYFSSSPGGKYSFEKWLLWRGMVDFARDLGVNVIYVAGDEFEKNPQAVLYDLIGTHNVDGIVVWNSFFSQRVLDEELLSFLERYHPLPIAIIERELPGYFNILFDNEQAVRQLVDHLVQVHGHKKIAYLTETGNYTAARRQQVFAQVLDEYGILDPRLIGTVEELDGRGIQWGIDCRAAVACDDVAAIDWIHALRERGLQVPGDVAVVSFNDGQEARSALPPMTTIRIPYRQMGRRVVESLVQIIRGQAVPAAFMVAGRFSPRRSCGCLEPLAERAAAGMAHPELLDSPNIGLEEIRLGLPARIAPHLGTSDERLIAAWSTRLVDLFFTELGRAEQQQTEAPFPTYLSEMSDLVREAIEHGANITRWHEALSILRASLLPALSGNSLPLAEDMWQQARVLIGQVAVRYEINRVWQTTRRAEILREIEADLLTAFEFGELLDIFVQGIARLGITDIYLVLYEGVFDPAGRAQLALAYQNGGRVDIEPAMCTFPVREILPEAFRQHWSGASVVIEALHLRDQQLGYLVIESPPPADAAACDLYQALRIQLSSGLRAVRLRQKLQDARSQAEEANHLKSRFLSMVSHELRTPLNLIVALSEVAIRQQARGSYSNEIQQKYLEQIYVSGQHLDRLIRDVLDLASSQVGQMSLIRKPLDLVPVIDDVASMGEQLALQKNLSFRVDRPDRLPVIEGDKTRLRQILLNLISNAVKFTAHGEVALIAKEEGGELLIAVQDTGLGIPRQEQERIFDEFHQSDRSVARGYGGIGLGLAITRTLVEMHGGRIWVTSDGAEGSGSTFQFTLPVAAAWLTQTTEHAHSGSRPGRVLVATGDSAGGAPLIDFLTENGFLVEQLVLHDPLAFLDDVLLDPPGAIVLDIAPASEVGWDLMKRVKENPSTQDIPVLFYSFMQDGDAGAVLEMDYLTKPVGAKELLQALKRHGLMSRDRKGVRTILIIDDEAGIRDLHAQIIYTELPHCRVLTAADGQEGLSIMRQEIPDLILLDLMMPELDGFGVLKIMQSEEALRAIPVIVLSGQALTNREMAWLNQGVATVLSKGIFRTPEILRKINSILARNTRQGSESQKLVQQAILYIHDHFNEPISRIDIANHLSINEQYLSRCFNKELGIGPMVYLSRYRIQRARRLLETGTLSVTQVAMEVGMSSQSYFSRVFQEETGVTPSAYQRGIRSGGKQ